MLLVIDDQDLWSISALPKAVSDRALVLLVSQVELSDDASHKIRRRLYDEGCCSVADQRIEWNSPEAPRLEYRLPTAFNRELGEIRRYRRFPHDAAVESLLKGVISTIIFAAPVSADRHAATRFGFRCHTIGYYPDAGAVPATPDCIHQDNVDWTSIMLLRRRNIVGGVNEFYDVSARDEMPEMASEHHVSSVVLREPGDMLVWDDRKLAHYVSPVARKSRELFGERIILITDVWTVA